MLSQQTGKGRFRLGAALVPGLCACLLSACGSNPAGPTGPLAVTAISPSTGPTSGGTRVAIAGANFLAGATVTIGGVPATDVVVVSVNQITARTPQHAAGATDVAVAVGSGRGVLPAGFTYTQPVTNDPPVIQSIVAQGSQEHEPAQFADLNEEVDVMATVTDKESSPESLTYEWTSDVGAFEGTGNAVKWKAPNGVPTPLIATLTLTVIEKYQGTDANGQPAQLENRVTGTSTVSVHASVKEVGDMATLFLVNFSKSEVPVNEVMKDFTPTCSGDDNERQDVEDNRADYHIDSWRVDPARVTINFKDTCQTVNGPRQGDACSNSNVEWKSTVIKEIPGHPVGSKEDVVGVDQIAAKYLDGRWWLCSSDFDGHSVLTGLRFTHWGRH